MFDVRSVLNWIIWIAAVSKSDETEEDDEEIDSSIGKSYGTKLYSRGKEEKTADTSDYIPRDFAV